MVSVFCTSLSYNCQLCITPSAMVCQGDNHKFMKKVLTGTMDDNHRNEGVGGSKNPHGEVRLAIIGVVRSCFSERFGIPRQPGLVPAALGRLDLVPPYNRREMVRGLEEFSHLWVQFLFHQTLSEGWKATIRPPRLGGRRRVGVFASRSPHRPNHLGLSVVKLEAVVEERDGVALLLSGIDLLDRTPVLDIKPYIPYSDSPAQAFGGYAQGVPEKVEIVFQPEAREFCQTYRVTTGRDLEALIRQVVGNDPRPASQKGRKNSFATMLWGIDVRWVVGETGVVVEACRQLRVE